jgi:hypothetical protein
LSNFTSGQLLGALASVATEQLKTMMSVMLQDEIAVVVRAM